MRAVLFLAILVMPVVPLASCDKPGEKACQQAIDNMNKIYAVPASVDTRPSVAKCRAQWSTSEVKCTIDATSEQGVDACLAAKK